MTQMAQRKVIVQSFIDSESDYVDYLIALGKLFYTPLRQDSTSKYGLTTEDITVIFRNATPITRYQTHLLQSLKTCLTDWSLEHPNIIAESFLERKSLFEGIRKFSVGHIKAIHLLEKVLNENSNSCTGKKYQNFQVLHHDCVRSPDSGGHTLPWLLSAPIQRLSQYIDFFKKLLEVTQPDHEDYENSTKVQEYLIMVKKKIDAAIISSQNQLHAQQLQQQLNELDINTDSRMLLKMGELCIDSDDKQYMFYLFNDLLIYICNNEICGRIEVDENFIIEDINETHWKIISPTKSLTIESKDNATKEAWLNVHAKFSKTNLDDCPANEQSQRIYVCAQCNVSLPFQTIKYLMPHAYPMCVKCYGKKKEGIIKEENKEENVKEREFIPGNEMEGNDWQEKAIQFEIEQKRLLEKNKESAIKNHRLQMQNDELNATLKDAAEQRDQMKREFEKKMCTIEVQSQQHWKGDLEYMKNLLLHSQKTKDEVINKLKKQVEELSKNKKKTKNIPPQMEDIMQENEKLKEELATTLKKREVMLQRTKKQILRLLIENENLAGELQLKDQMLMEHQRESQKYAPSTVSQKSSDPVLFQTSNDRPDENGVKKSDIIKEGDLMKKSGQVRLKRWQRRYVKLTKTDIFYYKNLASNGSVTTTARGTNLASKGNIKIVDLECAKAIDIEDPQVDKNSHCFSLIFNDSSNISRRAYFFSAGSEVEKKDWMTQINDAIRNAHEIRDMSLL